jgi:UDP-3-O-[3-hydroxymyristoyl] glucosamine N-acyltransferase
MTRQSGSFTLGELAELAGAEVSGDPARVIRGVGSLVSATEEQISHLSSATYRTQLETTRAGAVILSPDDAGRWSGDALLAANPYLAFARITQKFEVPPELNPGVDASARVAASAVVDPQAAVGAGAVIGARTTLGPGVKVHPGAAVGDDCTLAADVVIMPNAVIYADVRLGERTIIHSGAVIGGDGFGFTPDEKGALVAIAQLGGVTIGADVSVGAASAIDRGALDDTIVEDGVKIDNQVQIGHNSHIGAHTVICGCVGIAGSSKIGRHVVLAGGAGVGGDHPVEICDQVVLSATTVATSSITEPGIYSGGVLHSPTRQWKRNALRLLKLDDLFRRVASIERKLDN